MPAKGCVRPVLAPAQAWVRAGVWRRSGAFLLEGLAFVSRLLFAAQRQTKRLAECSGSIPPWVGIVIRAFSGIIRLSSLFSSLGACALSYGDPDGVTKSAAQCEYDFA